MKYESNFLALITFANHLSLFTKKKKKNRSINFVMSVYRVFVMTINPASCVQVQGGKNTRSSYGNTCSGLFMFVCVLVCASVFFMFVCVVFCVLFMYICVVVCVLFMLVYAFSCVCVCVLGKIRDQDMATRVLCCLC